MGLQPFGRLGVQMVGRLIEENDLCVHQEHTRQVDLLLLSSAHLSHSLIQQRFHRSIWAARLRVCSQSQPFRRSTSSRRASASGDRLADAIWYASTASMAGWVPPAESAEVCGPVEGPGPVPQSGVFAPPQDYVPFVGKELAPDYFQKRGFPGSIASDQTYFGAQIDSEGHPIQDGPLSERVG